MNANTKYLREKRKKAHADAVQFLTKGLTTENRAGYDRAMDDVETLGREIEAIESEGRYVAPVGNEDKNTRAVHAFAFDKYMRGGIDALNPEERKVINARSEKRDQTAGQITLTQSTGTAGGYLVPAGFADEIDIATKFYCPLMDSGNARTITTDSGSILPFPTSNDTGNVATLVGEGASVTEQDISFGNVNFGSYKYNSRVVKVTSELLQDSFFNIYEFLAARFAERFGRAYEAAFTTGSGSAQPTGFLTAIAASGATPVSAAGSAGNTGGTETGATSIGSQDLVNLEHSVDPSYRRGAKYIMHDKTLGLLQGLLDKFGRPLWTPGVTANSPDMINGYPYVINQSMPQVSASNVTVAFGDWSKFLIRKVSTPTIKRLVELYAVSDDAVGFVAFQRVDSNLVDAGTHPLNVLQQHS
jgi:HK97 family phage major capsid protein